MAVTSAAVAPCVTARTPYTDPLVPIPVLGISDVGNRARFRVLSQQNGENKTDIFFFAVHVIVVKVFPPTLFLQTKELYGFKQNS